MYLVKCKKIVLDQTTSDMKKASCMNAKHVGILPLKTREIWFTNKHAYKWPFSIQLSPLPYLHITFTLTPTSPHVNECLFRHPLNNPNFTLGTLWVKKKLRQKQRKIQWSCVVENSFFCFRSDFHPMWIYNIVQTKSQWNDGQVSYDVW